MTPGGSIIFSCPHCGRKKSLLAILSGNTFGSILWSDNKMIAPMLPRPSYIQKCNNCGQYYTLGFLDSERNEEECFDLGELNYQQTKEAIYQMEKNGFINFEDELNVRINFIQSYNDEYSRKNKHPSDEDRILFMKNIHILVDSALWPKNEIFTMALKAEYLREIGDFERAIDIISHLPTSKIDFENEYIRLVKEKIIEKNTEVFRIR